jgi:NAD+ synthase
LDLCLYAVNHGMAAAEVCQATGLTIQQVERVYRDLASKRRVSRYLHHAAVLVEDVG